MNMSKIDHDSTAPLINVLGDAEAMLMRSLTSFSYRLVTLALQV